MTSEHQTSGERSATISRDDLRRILGDVDDAKIIEILDLKPTLPEVEQAAIWATGDGDVLAKSGHPLAGVASDIVDILTVDEEDEAPPR